MAERKIEIQMATVGAAEAAAQIDQSTASVENLAAATENQATSTDDLEQRIAALKERTTQLKGETDQAATAGRQDIQINQQRAMMVLQVAEQIGKMSSSIRAAAADFREANPELSGTLETTAGAMEQVGTMASYAAQGFAIAGPAGAAVGAAIGLAVPQLEKFYDAWVDLEKSMGDVADSEQRVIDLQDEMAEMRGVRAAITAYNQAATAADEFANAAARAARRANAKGDAEKAEREAADDEAIRGGADELEIKRRNVNQDEAANRDRIREEGRVAAVERTARENAARLAEEAYAEAADKSGADSDQAKDMAEKLREAEAALKKAQEQENKWQDTGPYKIRESEARQRNAIGDIDFQAQERARKEDEKRAREEREYSDMREREAAAEAARKEREEQAAEQREAARRNQTRSTAGAAMGIADGAERAGATSGFVDALRGRAAAAQANPSAANAAELAKMLDQLLTAIESGKAGDEQEAAALKRRITALERREKNR